MNKALRELAFDLASFGIVLSGAHALASTLLPTDELRALITTALILLAAMALSVSARIEPARLVPSALALHFLPWASDREPLVLGVSVLAIGLLRLAAPDGSALVAPSRPSWRDPYALALLLVALALGAHHVAVAGDQATAYDNDAAYYYGVARHIAATGRLDEPIVWHFLVPQPHVVHPAFDYWQGLTSLLLVVPFLIYGASHAVAATTMALVGVGIFVLLWALLTQTGLVRHRLVQLAALIAYAFTPTLARFRLDSETVCVYQLFLVLALFLLAKQRPVAAVLAAFPLVMTRGDGTFALAILGVAALAIARTRREKLRVVLTGVVLTGLLIAFYEVHFGTPTPPGASAALRIQDYLDLYRLHQAPRTLDQVRDVHIAGGVFDTAIASVRDTYGAVLFSTLARYLMPLVALAATRLPTEHGTRGVTLRTALVFAVLLPFFLAWTTPIVFSPWRTLHGLIPVLVLVLAIGFDAGLSYMRAPRVGSAVLEAFVLAVLMMHLASVSMLQPDEDQFRLARTREVQRLSSQLGHSVVMTTGPWWIVAETDARAVSLPIDDLAAVEECIQRYDVEFLVIGSLDGWARDAVARVQQGGLGRYLLEPVPNEGYYRVLRVRPRPEETPPP